MKFTIIIQCGPDKKAVVLAAAQFIEAICNSDHSVNRVFFYGDGVYLANDNCVPSQDETPPEELLKSLLSKHRIANTVCIATAIKRGVLDKSEQERYEKMGRSLTEPFELGGLGQLIESSTMSDRTVTFA